eukprot:Gb_33541 [translate_table: standard]
MATSNENGAVNGAVEQEHERDAECLVNQEPESISNQNHKAKQEPDSCMNGNHAVNGVTKQEKENCEELPPKKEQESGSNQNLAGNAAVKYEAEQVRGGEVLYCGPTDWDAAGRKQIDCSSPNIVSPTRLRPFLGIDICFVASGCSSFHCVALDVNGHCYTWGRNEMGQLGHGDTIQRDVPTIVSILSRYKIVKAGVGKQHTVVLTEDGNAFAFGCNKHGQLGSGSTRKEMEVLPIRCLVSETTNVACGADFTMWLSPTQGSSIMSAGLPQYGQLGHGTDNEYNAKEGSVRLAYEAQPHPRAIAALSEKTITKVACGSNHTVAVDSNGFVYTWGFGGYGRLGHKEQKDEWIPRRVDFFQRSNVLPPSAVVAAGGAFSACTAVGGQLYMWGKVKQHGECWMYPKPLYDLSGWIIRCMGFGNMHSVCGADDSCISWGLAHHGELGYGSSGPKSSANPKKIDILDGMNVLSVASGCVYSLIVVDRANVADRIEKLDVYDGKDPSGVVVAKADIATDLATKSGKKRKAGSDEAPHLISAKREKNHRRKSSKKKDLSETKNIDDGEDNEEANGSPKKKEKDDKLVRGRGRGKPRKKMDVEDKKHTPASRGGAKGRGHKAN